MPDFEIDWSGQRASIIQKDFHYLIGLQVTFKSDMKYSDGVISHKKGEKAIITDVEYDPAYWCELSNLHKPPKFRSLRINGDEIYSYQTFHFEEFDAKDYEFAGMNHIPIEIPDNFFDNL